MGNKKFCLATAAVGFLLALGGFLVLERTTWCSGAEAASAEGFFSAAAGSFSVGSVVVLGSSRIVLGVELDYTVGAHHWCGSRSRRILGAAVVAHPWRRDAAGDSATVVEIFPEHSVVCFGFPALFRATHKYKVSSSSKSNI